MKTTDKNKAILLLALGTLWSSTALAGSVDTLTTFTAGTTAKASEVNGNFSAVTTAVNDNDSRISAVESEIATNITNTTNDISANTSDISTNTSDIAAINDAISNLKSDIASKQEAIVAPCADGSSIRAINADGTVVCEVDDAQNGSASVSALAMEGTISDTCDIRKTVSSGYAYFNTTSTSTTCLMAGNIQLPDGATPTSFHCRIWDNDGTAGSPVAKLYRAPVDGATAEVMYETSAVLDSASVQYVFDDSNATAGIIDNAQYSYYVALVNGGIDTTSVGTNMRFYNCHVDYGYNLLN